MTAATTAVPVRSTRRTVRSSAMPSALGWWLFLLYLVLELDRPPLLIQLRLQMVIAIVLPLLWFGGRERPWSMVLTAQLVLLGCSAASVPIAENWYAAYFTSRAIFSSVGISCALPKPNCLANAARTVCS